MGVIDCQRLADQLLMHTQQQVMLYMDAGYPEPGLVMLGMQDDWQFDLYVKRNIRLCDKHGFNSMHHVIHPQQSQRQVIGTLKKLNQRQDVNGIILGRPIAPEYDADSIMHHIDVDKDIEGMHPLNFGKTLQDSGGFRPCTVESILLILDSIKCDLKGKHVVIVGQSNIIGKPLAMQLLHRNSTVTLCNEFTQDIVALIGQADVLISAAGVANLIKAEWLSPGVVVIDVGINRLEDGSIVGDVEFSAAQEKAAWITKVPSGVGLLTQAVLLRNTCDAWLAQYNLKSTP